MMDFSFEREAWEAGALRVAGIDEVGRGPWAGPVVAAAVIVPRDEAVRAELLAVVRDSKTLSAAKREVFSARIWEVCEVGVGEASVAEIDRFNILQATFMAMRRAVGDLGSVDTVLVDGNKVPEGLTGNAIVKGDAVELNVACASVVAKVYRDTLMARLDADFPGYGWAKNAGYGVPAHKAGLEALGVNEHHRTSFAPIKIYVKGAA
ncbi:MAG: ribonuclease HII [Alphaproteobacteria bacterium CG_4_10_14_0_8_um_filter_53_9]|nr:MAG: ribonuclease HII [Alphaproteobacteria bacterium CG_4_10_14_0_8_um_filter_53_9]